MGVVGVGEHLLELVLRRLWASKHTSASTSHLHSAA